MAAIWDNVVASATKAANQAGKATEVAATKAKLHADLLVIDRDIHARKEKFGVEMYAHLEAITSTQEFYVADDRLINILRPTLIKAQREVAAYERKRDSMRGKANLAEANRSGSASIFTAATFSEKIMNAAKYAAAGAKEAASKTELAMLERQILGFKEEFGVELYPVLESMEDNEGWLPTDRKVRSLYDSAREDIGKMKKMKEEKNEQIKLSDGVEGTGISVSVPTKQQQSSMPMAVATPVSQSVGGGYVPNQGSSTNTNSAPTASWASTVPSTTTAPQPPAHEPAYGGGYGSSQQPPAMQTTSYGGMEQAKQLPTQQQPVDTGFGFMQTTTPSTMPQYNNNPVAAQQSVQQQPQQPPQQQSFGGAFDQFDGLATASNAGSSFSTSSFNNSATASSTMQAPSSGNAFDPFSRAAAQSSNGGKQLNDADMNLFKY